MTKRVSFLFIVLFAGLVLVACGALPSSENVADSAATDNVVDPLGSGPIRPPEGADEGPVARGATGITSDVGPVCLSAAEAELARLINEYRGTRNLPPVPVSKSLTLVAQQHAWDSVNNTNSWPAPPDGQSCNLHSWSGVVNPALQQGTWTPVCYTSDHAQMRGMHVKPRELAGYPADGFENSFWASGTATAAGALEGWQNSPGHNAVITEQNGWGPFKAMGVGMSGGIAHLWFGDVTDPAGEAQLCGGGAAVPPTEAPAVEPTAVPPTEAPAVEPTAVPPTEAPAAEPTAVPPTEAPAVEPTAVPPTEAPAVEPTAVPPTEAPAETGGQVLNAEGEVTAEGSVEHTFDVVQGGSYTVVITPSADFDVAPSYSCTVQGGSQSGTFDEGFEGDPETASFNTAGNGTCTVTVGGYEGSQGTYTIVVTAQ